MNTLLDTKPANIIIFWLSKITVNKTPKFHLISWCANFVERHSFYRVSSKWLETLWKLCFSTKWSHYEKRSNYSILCSGIAA